jgi:hypothetical protein
VQGARGSSCPLSLLDLLGSHLLVELMHIASRSKGAAAKLKKIKQSITLGKLLHKSQINKQDSNNKRMYSALTVL